MAHRRQPPNVGQSPCHCLQLQSVPSAEVSKEVLIKTYDAVEEDPKETLIKAYDVDEAAAAAGAVTPALPAQSDTEELEQKEQPPLGLPAATGTEVQLCEALPAAQTPDGEAGELPEPAAAQLPARPKTAAPKGPVIQEPTEPEWEASAQEQLESTVKAVETPVADAPEELAAEQQAVEEDQASAPEAALPPCAAEEEVAPATDAEAEPAVGAEDPPAEVSPPSAVEAAEEGQQSTAPGQEEVPQPQVPALVAETCQAAAAEVHALLDALEDTATPPAPPAAERELSALVPPEEPAVDLLPRGASADGGAAQEPAIIAEVAQPEVVEVEAVLLGAIDLLEQASGGVGDAEAAAVDEGPAGPAVSSPAAPPAEVEQTMEAAEEVAATPDTPLEAAGQIEAAPAAVAEEGDLAPAAELVADVAADDAGASAPQLPPAEVAGEGVGVNADVMVELVAADEVPPE